MTWLWCQSLTDKGRGWYVSVYYQKYFLMPSLSSAASVSVNKSWSNKQSRPRPLLIPISERHCAQKRKVTGRLQTRTAPEQSDTHYRWPLRPQLTATGEVAHTHTRVHSSLKPENSEMIEVPVLGSGDARCGFSWIQFSVFYGKVAKRRQRACFDIGRGLYCPMWELFSGEMYTVGMTIQKQDKRQGT